MSVRLMETISPFFNNGWYWVAGAVLLLIALGIALDEDLPARRQIVIFILAAAGLLLASLSDFSRGLDRGSDQGARRATYQTARLFANPVSKDKLKENTPYKIWNNMPEVETVLVLDESGVPLLVQGLKDLQPETKFMLRNGEIFILSAKTTEKK